MGLRRRHSRPTGAPSIELVRYLNAEPVFIVGCVRSGTSAMMAALRDGAGIRGFNEGVLAQLLPGLLSAVHRHYSSHHQKPMMNMLGSVPETFLATGIKNVFGKAFIETMGEGRWLDKTPGGPTIIAACPSLLEMFPNAKFVFCRRRGIENVLSRQRKFQDRDFKTHCEGWASTMAAWQGMAPQLGNAAIAIDQREMGLEPDLVSAKLADFLVLSTEQRRGIIGVLRNRRLEQTRAVQDVVPIRLKDTGWSTGEQETFRRVCGSMMAAFGYDLGEELVKKGSSKRLAYQFFVPIANDIVQRENIADRKACRPVNATRFKIDPNPHAAPPAALRHRMVRMEDFRHFSAKLRAVGKGAADSDGLVFRFALERSDDHSLVFAAEQIVKAGPPSAWICGLPSLSGEYDAILSVRPVSDLASGAQISGLWIDAQLA
jgi:Sulfotransferase family